MQLLMVLNVNINGRTIEEVKEETSARIANLAIPGRLLDRDYKTVCAFDYKGIECKEV